jgi:4-aminobutyrate aminotransferase-like enzyme/Ser/Thr protein kinase RdoA (MazF antagonist)
MLMPEARVAPPVSPAEAARLALSLYGINAVANPLPGEYDDNFRLVSSDSREFVLKIMHSAREQAFVDMQCRALLHLAQRAPHHSLPRVCPSIHGEPFAQISLDGSSRFIWLLTFLPGKVFAEVHFHSIDLLERLGRLLAEIDVALLDFSHPFTARDLKWDVTRSLWAREFVPCIPDSQRRAVAAKFLDLFEQEALSRFPRLRRSVIYGDANDYNVLVSPPSPQSPPALSLIDFGDMHESILVAEPAIAAAYAVLGQEHPLSAASAVLAAYHRIYPLTDEEIAAFFPLLAARLTVSVINSTHRKSLVSGDPYVTVSETPAWAALELLAAIEPRQAHETFRAACALPELRNTPASKAANQPTIDETLAARRKFFAANLSLSYDRPLKIVRGWRQYLYDDTGRAFLDVYNNVPLVGHSHPRVVRAVQDQIAVLNTNTRYLHDNANRYAERLTALLPAPLRICYFVNSGSEANELGLRLARAHTGREDVLVLEHAYHGNTSTLIDISPYKFNGPGGRGQKPWVHVAPIPDDYRGLYRRGEPDLAPKYAAQVSEILDKLRREGKGIAAYIAETLPSVAGQIVFPPGYLEAVYKLVRAHGGVCIADEVQIGFGRLGSHFWGFESQQVVPDIVVFGKPIANGFPLAAVVTTPEIAAAFANGMEFFSTFGGNPVACAAGLAVLDVLRDEHLQHNALEVGSRWTTALQSLQSTFPLLGDVRGSGLFLGLDLVNDRKARAPATTQAAYVVNRLRDLGFLAGTDGPHHNVIKLRPPLIFTDDDSALFTSTLSRILAEDPAQPA